MMPAGTYYIGDLCYVMHDEWDEFCDLTIKGNECLDGEFTLADGRKFAQYGTAYGDGLYHDKSGGKYPVDAGLIGCIMLAHIDLSNKDNCPDYGRVYTFSEPFEVSTEDGTIFFGNEIAIATGDEDYDDEDYDDEDYDDEDYDDDQE